ncbi:uncharacterized protein LOC111704281, partial [Eurytemora carolleeae]|uniref:uncharacterized protein LOC111704281 n=1 Tax=Eurytemora carolleeae TaxID=1294199 RepID=UPI000C770E50
MASRPSPSSSSDVEEVDDVEEGIHVGPVFKKRRLSEEHLPLPPTRTRSVESDSTDRCSGSSSSSGSRTVFVCTSRGAARPAPASIPKSTGCTGKLPCTCSTRCRGGSAEKDSKMTRPSGRTNTGKGCSSGRSIKEQWMVHGGERGRVQEDPQRWREGGRGGEDPPRWRDEPGRWRDRGRGVEEQISSSQGGEPAELASLQARLRQREEELYSQREEKERFLRELQDSVECPVCFSIPRTPPVPCCQNGHVICTRCKEKVEVCPTCRIPMSNCVSQVAATIIQRIQHPCDFREAGCDTRCDISSIDEHEESCGFRLVRCPHWACDELVSLTSLTSHVISSECGDNYMSKPLPYQEEIEYTRALDDQDGSSFWRPSLLQFNNITFYLQIEKSGKSRQWYFYVQMEGSTSECDKFETQITVCKSSSSDRFSISYYGKVCPIDTKGAEELDNDGCGLNVRDAVMEKIFTVDNTSGHETQKEREGEASRVQMGEKEEGEVGDQGEEG